jgi:hypothetical protein
MWDQWLAFLLLKGRLLHFKCKDTVSENGEKTRIFEQASKEVKTGVLSRTAK